MAYIIESMGDNEHRVFFLDTGINLYFSKHDQSSIYIIQRIEFSNEEYRSFILKVLPVKKANGSYSREYLVVSLARESKVQQLIKKAGAIIVTEPVFR